MKTLTLTDEQYQTVLHALDYVEDDFPERARDEDKSGIWDGDEEENYPENLRKSGMAAGALAQTLREGGGLSNPVLFLSDARGNEGDDWVMAEDARLVWVEVDSVSLFIVRDEDGVRVEAMAKGDEAGGGNEARLWFPFTNADFYPDGTDLEVYEADDPTGLFTNEED